MLLQCILVAIGNKARVEVLHFETRRAGKVFESLKWSHHGSEKADRVLAVVFLFSTLRHKHTHTHTHKGVLGLVIYLVGAF